MVHLGDRLGDELDAPAVTFVWVEPSAERAAFARADDTVVLSIGAGAPGTGWSPAGWDTNYLEGEQS